MLVYTTTAYFSVYTSLHQPNFHISIGPLTFYTLASYDIPQYRPNSTVYTCTRCTGAGFADDIIIAQHATGAYKRRSQQIVSCIPVPIRCYMYLRFIYGDKRNHTHTQTQERTRGQERKPVIEQVSPRS